MKDHGKEKILDKWRETKMMRSRIWCNYLDFKATVWLFFAKQKCLSVECGNVLFSSGCGCWLWILLITYQNFLSMHLLQWLMSELTPQVLIQVVHVVPMSTWERWLGHTWLELGTCKNIIFFTGLICKNCKNWTTSFQPKKETHKAAECMWNRPETKWNSGS